jgi:hypothetical protein
LYFLIRRCRLGLSKLWLPTCNVLWKGGLVD